MTQATLAARAEATRRTLAKYRALAFDWKGKVTCIHLARHHLRNMGHAPPPIPAFQSPIGARRALAKAGYENLTDLLNSLLPRIAAASAWVGDVATLDGGEGFDSIVINAGGKWIGFHEDATGIKPLIVTSIKGAWRV